MPNEDGDFLANCPPPPLANTRVLSRPIKQTHRRLRPFVRLLHGTHARPSGDRATQPLSSGLRHDPLPGQGWSGPRSEGARRVASRWLGALDPPPSRGRAGPASLPPLFLGSAATRCSNGCSCSRRCAAGTPRRGAPAINRPTAYDTDEPARQRRRLRHANLPT
eukprot:1180178-Prorocentrum_minimum.AAC.1